MSSEAYAAILATGARYGLSKEATLKVADKSDAIKALLKRHVVAPAAVGGALGAGMGLFHGTKDVITGAEPDAPALLHPALEALRGGVRGAQAGVGANAALEGLRAIGRGAGYNVPNASEMGRGMLRMMPWFSPFVPTKR